MAYEKKAMKRIIVLLVSLLCETIFLHGQVVDSASWRGQGQSVYKTGKGMMVTGAITAAVGGGIMWYVMSRNQNPSVPDGEFREDMGAALVYMLGAGCAITGAAFIAAGIPVTIAGQSMMRCDVPWRDARYPGRGLGIILEGSFSLPAIVQARTSMGYHFNSHTFLGAGLAPGYWLDTSSHDENFPRFSLPVYADFRWSLRNRLFTPYLWLSAGMELSGISPYLGAEIGTRIRTDRTSTRSFWSALTGEVAGDYVRAGIKMGYSF